MNNFPGPIPSERTSRYKEKTHNIQSVVNWQKSSAFHTVFK